MTDFDAPPIGEDAANAHDSHLMPEHVWQVVRQAARDPEADPVKGLIVYADTAPGGDDD